MALLLSLDRATSAYDLVRLYQERYEKPLPAITMYRILEILQGADIVHKLETENIYVVCSHLGAHSNGPLTQFLICGTCCKVEETLMPTNLANELNAALAKSGFRLLRRNLEINCICSECEQIVKK